MLSIIIPALNEEEYLPKLLDSVKKQKFSDYEIILADAGSKDRTLEIAKKYNCKITSGGLPAKGRNEGAKIAQGDILLFLDADAILPKNFLEKAINIFEQKKLGIAGFPVMPPDGKMIDKFFYNFLNVFSFLTQKFMPYTACAILAKKSVHNAIGGFDERVILLEDYLYGKSASKISKYRFMRELPFYTSARRFKKEGRFKVYSKYILAQLHMLFFGPVKSDVFDYKFNHYKDKDDTKK